MALSRDDYWRKHFQEEEENDDLEENGMKCPTPGCPNYISEIDDKKGMKICAACWDFGRPDGLWRKILEVLEGVCGVGNKSMVATTAIRRLVMDAAHDEKERICRRP